MMKHKDLAQLEQQMINSIDDEVRFDEEVKDLSAKIARDLRLTVSNKSKFEFMNREFSANAKINNKEIILLVADRENLSKFGNKYMPYIIKAENSPDFSLDENLKATIEGFLRSIAGSPVVGELED